VLEVGTSSDYGRQYLNIGRVAEADAILYQVPPIVNAMIDDEKFWS
jgi:hypothetical protein